MEHALKAVQTDNRVRRWKPDADPQWELLYKCSKGQVDWNSPEGKLLPPRCMLRPTPVRSAMSCPAMLHLALKSCMLCADTWLHVCLTCVCCICQQLAHRAEVQTCLSSKMHRQIGLLSCSVCIVVCGGTSASRRVLNVSFQHTVLRHPCYMLPPFICPSIHPSIHKYIHSSIYAFVHPSCSFVHLLIHSFIES